MRKHTNEGIQDFVSHLRAKEETAAPRGNDYPRISVVIPSFNQGKFLERTVLSVLNQGYPNLEVIVIDGGSTDGSLEIIRKYSRFFQFWVSEKDRGHADALNKGFRLATGEIYAWLNSDDLYLPGALDAVASGFQCKSTDAVYGNLYYIDSNERILEERRLTHFSRSSFLYGASDLLQPSMFWRRELFQAVGEINTEYVFSFDRELFCRFALADARFKFLREFLACFRIHPQSKTSTIFEVSQRDNEKIRSVLLRSFNSKYAQYIRAREKLQRVVLYLLQGDAAWLLRRLKTRLGELYSKQASRMASSS